MGNKVPLFAINNDRYLSTWCPTSKDEMISLVNRDIKIRDIAYRFARSKNIEISRILIKGMKEADVEIFSTRAGFLMGKGKSHFSALESLIKKAIQQEVSIKVFSVQNPEVDADAIASKIVSDLERRRPFSMSMKMQKQEAMRAGALGIIVECAGRLNGVEIARRVVLKDGKVPRKTIKSNVQYAFKAAYTNSGTCGVKVYINNNINNTNQAKTTIFNTFKKKRKPFKGGK